MPKVGMLRGLLKEKGATWSIAPELLDTTSLEDLASEHRLGSLQVPSGARTTLMPRIRPAVSPDVILAVPGSNRLLRQAMKAVPLPKTWDWRNVNGKSYVTPARHQGGCGSCVAFATTAAVESHHRIETNAPTENLDLSEASLFFVADRQCNLGDPNYGWWVPAALDALVTEGICLEESYPYRASNQVAQIPNGSPRTLKIHGYDSTTNTAQMKRWLVEDGPLVTAFTVYDDFFPFFNQGSGVYTHVTGVVRGGHAVCVVGYDDNQKAWICKNSWGTPAGRSDGCFLIGYGQCGIDSRMYLMQDVYDVYTIDIIPYDPTKLQIVNRGALGYMLTDGRMSMRLFDNTEDARNGLRVARRHNQQGFVGRDNPRTNRRDYILEYWAGNSGLPREPLTRTDAIGYNPNNVVATDLNKDGWRLQDGKHWMLIAHDMNDALAMLRVVERNSRICFIGRNNTRPNRADYIMTYFE